MIFIHAADLHLGSPLGGLDQHDQLPAPRIRQAPMRAFERLADLCLEREAALLVIAGDLFDGNAGVPTMREAAQVLERITRAGTHVVTIRGNHDADSRMQRSLPAIDRLHQLPSHATGSVEFVALGVAVHGRGFDTPRVVENIVPTYPPPISGLLNIGVLHTSLAGASGHDSYAPCSVDDLVARGYDYWALGHVHARAIHAEAPWIVHPGNIQGRDVGETGARGVTVVEYADGAVVGTPEHVDLDEVRWHLLELEIGELEEAEALVERATGALGQLLAADGDRIHVVRVQLSGRGAAHEQLASAPGYWRQELHDAVLGISAESLFLEHVRMQTSPALPPVQELLAREDFIGAAAQQLLEAPTGPTPIDADAFAVLDRKLGQLTGGLGDALISPVATVEHETAREALLSRLLVAHAEDAEAGR